MKCFKDKERICNEDCAAHIAEDDRDDSGLTCLELRTQDELLKRMETMTCSNDVNSFYMRVLAMSVSGLKSKLEQAF